MAEMDLDQLRTLILAWARLRPDIKWCGDRPNQAQLGRALRLDKGQVSKLMRSRMSKRVGVLRPRSTGYRITPDLMRAIMDAMGFVSEADFWEMVRRQEPTPPFPTTGRR